MAAFRLNRIAWLAFALLNVLLLTLIALLLQFRAGRAELARLDGLGAAVYPESIPLREIALTDQRGQPFRIGDMRGAWNLVFFGFSDCPDMCPLTLAEIERYYRDRGESAEAPVQVVFVSIDPADTPAIIEEYLDGFHEDFIGLSGSREAVAEFAAQMYANTGAETALGHGQPADAPEGMISHSIHIGVVGPVGELVGLLRPPHRAAAIGEALRLIMRRA